MPISITLSNDDGCFTTLEDGKFRLYYYGDNHQAWNLEDISPLHRQLQKKCLDLELEWLKLVSAEDELLAKLVEARQIQYGFWLAHYDSETDTWH